MKPDFPNGLSRLIQHPAWLSRECAVPTCQTFTYQSWENVRKTQRSFIAKGRTVPRAITCKEENNRDVQVTVMGGAEVRHFFESNYKKKMLDRISRRSRNSAFNWAIRLGASLYEAEVFSKMMGDEQQIWDYVSGLIGKSGLLTFQPWVARDVKNIVESSSLPLQQPHDSIHVRRGDKVKNDSREEVVNYWHSQGFERQSDFPLNYIPFSHYLRLWEDECKTFWYASDGEKVRTVYVASDDIAIVKKEISNMPKSRDGTTIVGGCERVRFVFNPTGEEVAFHLNEGGARDDCSERYKRNINSISDLMIVTKSNTFVGEFTSNWGRLVRIFRTKLNDKYVLPEERSGWKKFIGIGQREHEFEPPVYIKDIRLAFAEDKEVPPPGW